MPPRSDSRFFEPPQNVNDQGSKFHCFPLLPAELRQKIWLHSMQRERLLTVELQLVSSYEIYGSWNGLLNDKLYKVFVENCEIMTKLFWVTRESRQAALRFYRVSIQCNRERVNYQSFDFKKTFKSGILHFNPEYDFLQIKPDHVRIIDTFIDF